MAGLSPRKEGNRRPRNRVLVITEGTTEKLYFSGLKERGCNVTITTPGSSVTDAENLVRFCAKQKDFYGIDQDDGDLAICVFDFDENPRENIRKASRLASKNGILLAASNPCFELWIALHFMDIDRCFSSKELLSLVKRHIKGYRKTDDYNDVLFPLMELAIHRADNMLNAVGQIGASIEDLHNPGTSVHIAVRAIDELKLLHRGKSYSKGPSKE